MNLSSNFEHVAWIETTKRRSKYQIIRCSEDVFEWHLIRGVLAVSHGREATFDAAKLACEADQAKRHQQKQEIEPR